ncbi:MAG: acyltransferase family protein [Oscillospiraceae bacterium]|nr:acyltransferase family protein [Oscillospiraceae bacterium]
MSGAVEVRNKNVDILRGIAMLMVILGHTMTGYTENSQDTLLFNIIWTLQMPLFILISGYVTKYSRG